MQDLSFEYYDIPPLICLIAGVIYGVKFSTLNSSEKLIALIVFMNIVADTSAYFLIYYKLEYYYIYNSLLPLERAVSLLIYAKNEKAKRAKSVYGLGIALILLIYGIGYLRSDISSNLHYLSNTITALTLAALSYLHLRFISKGEEQNTRLVTMFTVATFIYSAFTVSAMSALPFALRINNSFATKIYTINLAAYSLWSIILIITILWKRKT